MNTYANQYSGPPPSGHYETRTATPNMNNNHDSYRPAQNGQSNSNGNTPHPGHGQYSSIPAIQHAPSQMNGQPSPHYYSGPPSSSAPSLHEPSHGNFYNPGLPAPGAPEGTRAELAPLAPGTEPKKDEPQGRSMVFEGRRYELFVIQQPIRARMCGFGDKDRRPITPPPCVKLVVTDVKTGVVVDNNEIDHGMFVISADLWHENGKDEVNMVRHSGSSPAISSTIPVSYQEMGLPPAFSHILPQSGFKSEPGQGGGSSPYNPYPGGPQVAYSGTQSGAQNYYQNNYPSVTNGSNYSSQNSYPQSSGQSNYNYSSQHSPSQMDYPLQSQQVPSNQYGSNSARSYCQSEAAATRSPISNSAPQGMFTRNLIGSLSTSAFKLIDCNEKLGIWFVLQDMSIRAEGKFRLRFSFVNVAVPVSPTTNTAPGAPTPMMVPTKTVAPVLASCFSDVFTVFSAKRFPGVVESTPLSRCFATQGIKIPIRKDGKPEKEQDYED
ncbi:related to VeA protein [Rhynchosporium secalis]|uniref:Related to VeA protein n=1 Tax=Rhynchosporium secalis TaxID=38038 RepID=A0A1E1MVR2_RHYSE|nr:related to VeA protein [Rhynchosporium secalis]